MNQTINKILSILNNVHNELLEASKLCDASSEKWIRNESLSIDKLAEILKMNIDSLRKSIAFNERVKASDQKLEGIESYLRQSRVEMLELNELLKQSTKYGFPERMEGEDENEYLKRLMADVNKTLSNNDKN